MKFIVVNWWYRKENVVSAPLHSCYHANFGRYRSHRMGGRRCQNWRALGPHPFGWGYCYHAEFGRFVREGVQSSKPNSKIELRWGPPARWDIKRVSEPLQTRPFPYV